MSDSEAKDVSEKEKDSKEEKERVSRNGPDSCKNCKS